MVDLIIDGGTVVTPTGRRRASVAITDGQISQVGTVDEPARERVDATGLMVMPGMVDSHVHLMDPADLSREDFPTGTQAAARAGVTTVVEHSHGQPVLTTFDLDRKREHLRGRAVVDFALAAHVMPDTVGEVAGLWDSGVAFLKAFTCTTHGITGFDPGQLRRLFQATAEVDAVCLVHCEDDALTREAEERLKADGREDGAVIAEWRNPEAELAAVAYTAMLARTTGARIVVAHVSNTEVLERIAWERARGADVVAETCPQYLRLREPEGVELGALRKFTPPARARTDRELERMWAAVSDGVISVVSSDHAPSTLEQKCAGSIWDVHFGLPGLDTTLPMLLTAAADGLIAYERIVEAYATAPARLYGLRGKGRVAPGADADLVLVDPERRWTLTNDHVHSRAQWTPYDGAELIGSIERTYVRGRLVCENGQVVEAPGWGRYLPAREETTRL